MNPEPLWAPSFIGFVGSFVVAALVMLILWRPVLVIVEGQRGAVRLMAGSTKDGPFTDPTLNEPTSGWSAMKGDDVMNPRTAERLAEVAASEAKRGNGRTPPPMPAVTLPGVAQPVMAALTERERAELEQLRANLDDVRKAESELHERLCQLQRERDSLRAECEAKASAIEKLTSELETTRNERKAAQSDAHDLAAKNTELRVQRDQAIGQRDRVRSAALITVEKRAEAAERRLVLAESALNEIRALIQRANGAAP